MLGSLDARRLQTCLMVDRGIFVYRLSYTFTVEYEQPIVDMVSQCLLLECSTWTHSSPPTTSNVHVWPSRVFCKPGIPYCFFSSLWVALIMLSFSHRVLLSRICPYSYRVTRVTNNTLCNVSPVRYFTETYLPVFFVQSHAFNNCPDHLLL